MTVPHWSLWWEVGARTHFGTHFRLVRLACPSCPVLNSPAQASGNSDDMRPQVERAVLPLHSILVCLSVPRCRPLGGGLGSFRAQIPFGHKRLRCLRLAACCRVGCGNTAKGRFFLP